MRAVNLLPADARAVHRSAAAQGLRRPPADRRRRGDILRRRRADGPRLDVELERRRQAEAARRAQGQDRRHSIPAAVIRSAAAAAGRTSPTVQSRRATVTGLADNRLAWDEFLATFSNVVPENVWLQSFQAATPGAAATLATAEAARAAAAAASVAAGTTTTARHSAPDSFAVDRCRCKQLHDHRLHLLPAVGRPPDAADGARALAERREPRHELQVDDRLRHRLPVQLQATALSRRRRCPSDRGHARSLASQSSR